MSTAARIPRLTFALLVLTILVLALSVPGSLADAWRRGGLYLLSGEFLADIPRRLAGPGRLRFLIQPTVACLLGIRAGVADGRAGRPPFLKDLLLGRTERRELLRSTLTSIANLLLMGILLDAIFQWVILGVSYPGAALVVGPVLIALPYAVARALANRATRRPA